MITNMTTQTMTEAQIEYWAERMQDQLDKRYLNSDMTEKEYIADCKDIAIWVQEAYEHRQRVAIRNN
jgi:hypothetical protein